MHSFEDWEYQWAGRVKSAAVLMLAVMLFLQQGTKDKEWNCAQSSHNYPQVKAAVKEDQDLSSLEAENPIDQFFSAISIEDGEPQIYACLYLDCWEQELYHAYEALAVEKDALTRTYMEQTASAFSVYAQTEGWLETYAEFSEDSQQEEFEFPMMARRILAQAELTRLQTLRIYSILQEHVEFVFQSEEVNQALMESGWKQN